MAINHTLREKEKQPLVDYTEFEGKEVIVRFAQFNLLVHLQAHGLFTKKNTHSSLASLKEAFNFLEKYTILFHDSKVVLFLKHHSKQLFFQNYSTYQVLSFVQNPGYYLVFEYLCVL